MPFILNPTPKKNGKPEAEELLPLAQNASPQELERLKEKVSLAYHHLDNVVDPLLIDSWIYEINAAQLRYQFCLQQLKQSPQQEKTGAV